MKIEVDEEKLRCLVKATLMNCMDLNYYIFHKKSCFDIECYDCPLEKVESVIKWLKEEQYEIR